MGIEFCYILVEADNLRLLLVKPIKGEADMTDAVLLDAVKLLADDKFTTGPNWEACHDLCQAHEGEPDYDLGHALVHLIEGDISNARYWYRRAGQEQVEQDIGAEWTRIISYLDN